MLDEKSKALNLFMESRAPHEPLTLVRVCDLDVTAPISFFEYHSAGGRGGDPPPPSLSVEMVEWLDEHTPGYRVTESTRCNLCLDFEFTTDVHAVLFQLRWR
jgi:hypothetical protein